MGALEVDQLSSLKLTNVYYDPNSVISLISAFLALVPQALLVVYITLIFAQRELEVVVMFSGQILCEALNWGLKRTFKQQRPERNGVVAGERTDDLEMHGKGYGMPSSHAQFVAFFATYLGLWLLLRVHYFSLSRRIRDTFLVAVMSVLVCISRVILNYHTTTQVLVGAVFGIFAGLVCFSCSSFLHHQSHLLAGILNHPISRYFYLRDSCNHKDIVRQGWQTAMDENLISRGGKKRG